MFCFYYGAAAATAAAAVIVILALSVSLFLSISHFPIFTVPKSNKVNHLRIKYKI